MSGPKARKRRFDAFVSYSHSADREVAMALEYRLKRFAKPWFRLRSANIFRDEVNLAASAHGWRSIKGNLDQAAHLILLASPTAVESPWVKRELVYWLTDGTCEEPEELPNHTIRPDRADSVFVVLTEGEIVWDNNAKDFKWDRTTGLPRSVLSKAFEGEPLWVDLRWARAEGSKLNLADPRFRSALAKLSSSIRGLDVATLVALEYAEHRRTIRHATIALTSLAVLLVLAVTLLVSTSIFANGEQQALQETRVRESKLLSSMSRVEVARENPIGGALMATEALPVKEARRQESSALGDTFRSYLSYLPWIDSRATRPVVPEAVRALQEAMHAYAKNRFLWRFQGHGGQISALSDEDDNPTVYGVRFDGTGGRVVTASADGTSRVLDAETGDELLALVHNRPEPNRAGEIAVREGGDVFVAAYSPDGGFIVTGAKNGTAKVWDARSGALKGTLQHRPMDAARNEFEPDTSDDARSLLGYVNGLVISPDSKQIITRAMNESLIVWRADTYKPLLCIRSDRGRETPYTADGRYFLTTAGGVLAVWKASDLSKLVEIGSKEDPVQWAEFSPNGRQLLLASKTGGIRIADLQGQRPSEKLPPATGQLMALSFDATGVPIACTLQQQNLVLWDLKEQKPLGSFSLEGLGRPHRFMTGPATVGMRRGQLCLQFTGTGGTVLVLLDLATGGLISGIAVEGIGYSVSFSRDGRRLAVGTSQGEVSVWDTSFLDLGNVIRGHSASVTSVRLHPRNARQIITASADGTAALWEISSRKRLLTFGPVDAAKEPLVDAMIDPAGKYVITRSRDLLDLQNHFNGTAHLWDVSDGRHLAHLHAGKNVMWTDFDSKGERILSGLRDGSIWLTPAASPDRAEMLFAGRDRVQHVVFADNETSILSAHGQPQVRQDNDVWYWQISPPKEIFRLTAHTAPVGRLVVRDDIGRILSCGWDGSVRVWDKRAIARAIAAKKTSFSQGEELAVIRVGKTRIETQNTRMVEGVRVENKVLDQAKTVAAFSPDGSLFVAAEERALVCTADGAQVTQLRDPFGKVRCVAWSPDSRLVATGGEHGIVQVWDPRSGQELFRFVGHLKAVTDLTFLGSGDSVVSASADTTVRMWDVDPDWKRLVADSRRLLPRHELTAAERLRLSGASQ